MYSHRERGAYLTPSYEYRRLKPLKVYCLDNLRMLESPSSGMRCSRRRLKASQEWRTGIIRPTS
jgi:hypothetical protein